MACRHLTRAEEIRKSTWNRTVVEHHLDLAWFSAVRQFATCYSSSETPLDSLVNNAGVMMCPKGLTEDGFETQLAISHLGHFLLTRDLLEQLNSCSPSCVIAVSSIAHKGGTDVSSSSLHPGVIRIELGRHVGGRHPPLFRPAVLPLKTPGEGARTSIYCAVTEGLEDKSGCYFSEGTSPRRTG